MVVGVLGGNQNNRRRRRLGACDDAAWEWEWECSERSGGCEYEVNVRRSVSGRAQHAGRKELMKVGGCSVRQVRLPSKAKPSQAKRAQGLCSEWPITGRGKRPT